MPQYVQSRSYAFTSGVIGPFSRSGYLSHQATQSEIEFFRCECRCSPGQLLEVIPRRNHPILQSLSVVELFRSLLASSLLVRSVNVAG
jgi:hypothetical protein